jgi:hypothetical protein
LKREDGRNLVISRETLSCMFDLTIMQASEAMGICHTTAKKMRAWAGIKRWPRNQVVCGYHPVFTLESVQRSRDALMARASAEGDWCLYNALFAASCLAFRNNEQRISAEREKRWARRRRTVIVLPPAPEPALEPGSASPATEPASASPATEQDEEDEPAAIYAELGDSLMDALPFFDALASPPPDRPKEAWLGGWQCSP